MEMIQLSNGDWSDEELGKAVPVILTISNIIEHLSYRLHLPATKMLVGPLPFSHVTMKNAHISEYPLRGAISNPS